MGYIDCFSVVSSAIDGITKKYNGVIQENASWKQVIKYFCEIIDDLAYRFDGESFEAEIDEHTLEIVISFVCGEILIESDKDELHQLIKYANNVSFEKDSEDYIRIGFRFDGIWEA